MNELRRFSHSLVETWMSCPKKAMYRYVENVPEVKGSALIRGSACDAAWNYDLETKITTGEDSPLTALLEITEAAFRDDVSDQGGVDCVDWGDGTARKSLDSALSLTKAWRTYLAPDIKPTAVQVRYVRSLPSGRQFIGYVDWEGEAESTVAVGDNKTGGRRLYQPDANKGLQPYAYAWLKQEPIDFVFARAIDTGKRTDQEFVWTHRSEGDITWYEQQVLDLERAWEAGIFPANPTGPFCGPTKCPFFERCQPHRTTHLTGTKEEGK